MRGKLDAGVGKRTQSDRKGGGRDFPCQGEAPSLLPTIGRKKGNGRLKGKKNALINANNVGKKNPPETSSSRGDSLCDCERNAKQKIKGGRMK